MRLLSHNTLRNNARDARRKGGSREGGFPLRITATEIRVVDQDMEDTDRQIAFVQGILRVIAWKALVQGAQEMGISSLPSELTEELTNEPEFLVALYQVLMNVHLIRGILTCPDTGREFPVTDGIPNFVFDEDEEEEERIRLERIKRREEEEEEE